MNIVEFFDADAIENFVSTLLCRPKRVVLVGSNEGQMIKAIENYQYVAAQHDLDVEFTYRKLGRTNLLEIEEVLTELLETYGPCSFDLTGGDDLYLVAVGAVFCAHREKVQLHRFNIRNGKLFDCDADGTVLASEDATLTIEEMIRICGGRVIFEDEKPNATYRWNFSDEFLEDLDNMWTMCKGNPGRWNVQVHTLDLVHRHLGAVDTSLTVSIDKVAETERIKREKAMADFGGGFFRELETYGLITGLRFSGDTLEFTYKNEQVKRCLTNAGRVLELYIAISAKNHTDKKGAPAFSDMLTGVTIDWDGRLATTTAEVENEIDVMLMRGLVPIFISCKNGRNFGADELYKLSTVAERFGGEYSRKLLVAPRLEDMETGEGIVLRAKELHINVLEKADQLEPVPLAHVFNGLL